MSNETVIWQKASEIFATLSDLPVTEAMEQLREQQNLTEEVREAVLVLINSAEHASRFFEDKILKAIPSQFQNVMKPGDKLDEYELLEQLGHGGMSQVFKAKRLKGTPQKLVAIKVFAPRSNQQELLSHFINEQQILSKFSHPNIVDMLHGGKTDDNIAYLVMELVENALPFDKFCNQYNLTDRKKISYIVQCAD
ncbi:MAG TPA: protein kinase, partial [Gammaproteobacteria bacterium]|nr:protein kinase [Gammaproteobacteria bacterium]